MARHFDTSAMVLPEGQYATNVFRYEEWYSLLSEYDAVPLMALLYLD